MLFRWLGRPWLDPESTTIIKGYRAKNDTRKCRSFAITCPFTSSEEILEFGLEVKAMRAIQMQVENQKLTGSSRKAHARTGTKANFILNREWLQFLPNPWTATLSFFQYGKGYSVESIAVTTINQPFVAVIFCFGLKSRVERLRCFMLRISSLLVSFLVAKTS